MANFNNSNTKLPLHVCNESLIFDKSCDHATHLFGRFNEIHGWFNNPLVLWSSILYKFDMTVLCHTISLERSRGRFCESHIEVPFTCLVFIEETTLI